MPFSGSEVSEKGFPRGWDADAEDQASQRQFRIAQLLEAMVFRPFSWDRFKSLNLKYAFHGGLIDAGDEWLLIDDGFVTLVEGSAPNFIERSDAGVVTVNQLGFTYLESIPMAQINARNGSFVASSYIDRRPEIGGAPTSEGGAITFAQIIGFILDSQVPLSAVAQHQFDLSFTFDQLLDQIADIQVPESAVTQHEAALSLLFTQLTDQIADDQVPLSAVLQYCAEISACVGSSFGGRFGGLTELLDFLLSRSIGPVAGDRIPASAVLQWSDELLQKEPFNFMLAQATSPRPGPADLIRLCGLILECDPFPFMLKRATSRRPWSVNDRCIANGALV